MGMIEEIEAEIKCIIESIHEMSNFDKQEAEKDLIELNKELLCTITDRIPLDRLKEICTAEREGRCVILPCNVGDKAFIIDTDCKDNPDHSKICFCWNKSCNKCEKAFDRVWEVNYETNNVSRIISNMGLCGEKGGFGKTVFLTREAAEAALTASKDNMQREVHKEEKE